MIALRPDQADDVVRARDALARHPRIVLQRPCATGKTVIACAISGAVTANGARTLILQHREELIAQTTRTLSEMGLAHGIIAAGQPHRDAPVQIASIATITRRLDAYQPGDFQLLLVDECHHAVAPTWRRVIDHFAGAYVVGLSASPLRLDGKGLDHLFGELVVGRSVKDYVGIGVLSPATTFAPPAAPDLRGIKKRGGDFEPEELARRMSNDTIVGDAVEHYRQLSPQLPGLVYCCSVAHSKLVAQAFCSAGYQARHVDGETPTAEREATIAELRAGNLDLVTNVQLFTEGLDVPLLGCILVLRPTDSLALHIQMIGRALRTAPGKRRGLILDHAGNSLRHGLYDFDHAWSLEGRPNKTGEPLVRRCPECGAMAPIAAQACPECGYEFVVPLRPAASGPGTIPETLPGQLVRADDDRGLRVQSQGGTLPYRRLLEWIHEPDEYEERWRRAERARRQNGYHKGWRRHVLEEPRHDTGDRAAARGI